MKAMNVMSAGLALALCLPGSALAEARVPFEQGIYVAPMASYVEPDSERILDEGLGATLALGYRASRGFAVELWGVMSELDPGQGGAQGSTLSGGGITALGFLPQPFSGFYLPFAVGYLNSDQQGAAAEEYKGLSLEAGLGYLLPLSLGRYTFGLRADARYRHHNGQDGKRLDEDPAGLQDVLFNLGLQLPFGLQPPPPPPPAPTPVVVAPRDGDNDGVIDSADRCPATPAGQAVDAQGCPEAPPPKCPESLDGKADVVLDGCTAGAVIALRGVHFGNDQSELDGSGESLLNELAQQLLLHPAMQIEVAGHTDNQGAQSYNQRLSDQRAQRVLEYLVEQGVEASRLQARGYGEDQPLADNQSADGRAANRRVEVRILSRGDAL